MEHSVKAANIATSMQSAQHPGKPVAHLRAEVCTCDDICAPRGKEKLLDGARMAPKQHAVQPPCLLQRGCLGHQRLGDAAAGPHLQLLLSQP